MRNKRTNMKEKGITLVALVVTIIVLLILAGVTIQLVLGQNGLIKRAGDASRTWESSRADEEAMMGQLHSDIDTHTQGTAEGSGSSTSGGSEEDVYRGLATASEAHEDIYNYEILTPPTTAMKSDTKIASTDGISIATSTIPGTAKIVGIKLNDIFNNSFGHNWPDIWDDYEDYMNALRPYFQKMVIPEEVTIEGDKYKITEIEYLVSSDDIGDYEYYSFVPSALFNREDFNFWNIIVPNGITEIRIYDSYLNYDYAGWALKSISLPNTLQTIQPYTFYGCDSLERINIPDSVSSIGSYAFSYCSSLTSANIVWNHPNIDIIQDMTFYWASQICPHSYDSDSFACGEAYCRLCYEPCQHQWTNGRCTKCGWECEHNGWNSSSGTCATCGIECSHDEWNDEGYCTTCEMYDVSHDIYGSESQE